MQADIAATAAALSGGQLARARALAGPLAPMRAAFVNAPTRVDGTGATAFALAEELGAAVDHAADAVTGAHAEELREFDAELERLGYARDAQRLRRRIDERHKRETRPHAHRSAARRSHRAREACTATCSPIRRRPSTGIDPGSECRRAPPPALECAVKRARPS